MRKRRELKLTSNLESIRTIEEFSERISDEYFLNDSYFGNIITCLSEAVTNAIVHGNKLDESKTVTVVMEEKVEGLLFTIIDQGEGYHFVDFSEGIPEGDRGKGIFTIRSLADEVTFEDGGRIVSILFRINGIDQNVADQRIQMLRDYKKASTKVAGKDSEE